MNEQPRQFDSYDSQLPSPMQTLELQISQGVAEIVQQAMRHKQVMHYLQNELETMHKEFDAHDQAREVEATRYLNDTQILGACIKAAIAAGNQEMVSSFLASFDNVVNKGRNHYEETVKFIVARSHASMERARFSIG